MALDASLVAALIFSYDALACAMPLSAMSRATCGASIFGVAADFVPDVVLILLMAFILGAFPLGGFPDASPRTQTRPLDQPPAMVSRVASAVSCEPTTWLSGCCGTMSDGPQIDEWS